MSINDEAPLDGSVPLDNYVIDEQVLRLADGADAALSTWVRDSTQRQLTAIAQPDLSKPMWVSLPCPILLALFS